MDRIRGEVGVMRDLAGRVKNCVLRWFGHVERMDGENDIWFGGRRESR